MKGLDEPTQSDKIPRCKTCKHCKITTSGQSGEYGQDVWIRYECLLHNVKVGYDLTCNKNETR